MSPEKILIVEDEIFVAMALKLELENAGYTVSGLSSTGAGAVEMAEADPPSIILMDIQLPGGMSGIEAIKRIRIKQYIPVIFITGYMDSSIISQINSIEGAVYINKPTGIEAIIHSIEQLRA